MPLGDSLSDEGNGLDLKKGGSNRAREGQQELSRSEKRKI